MMAPDGTAPHRPSWRGLVIERRSETVVVTIEGLVDGRGAEWLDAILRDLVEGQGNRSVTVDLAEAHVGDPAVVAVLAGFLARADGQARRFVVHHPPASGTEILRSSSLESVGRP